MNKHFRRCLVMVVTAVAAITASAGVAHAAVGDIGTNFDARTDNYNSNLTMAVKDASTLNNAVAIQTVYTSSAPNNDRMEFEWQGGSNWYRIKAAHTHKCLVVQNASTANNAPISQFTCTYDSLMNDVWLYTEPLIQIPGGLIKVAQFQNLNSQKCLVVSGGSHAAGTQLTQFTCSTANNSRYWYFV
jgi:hypothetical protein